MTVNEGDLVELTISAPSSTASCCSTASTRSTRDSPARFSLLAGEPGEYPIELVDADRQIGTLVIR